MRAVNLYRVSSKGQAEKDTLEIPVQRKIVTDFVIKNSWTLVREFTEGGISGFKVSANKRDALQTIKAMALNKEFDVLCVYASDRIGRIADESPLVVSFLNQCGVRVFSVTEGEIKTTTHVDKLLTYIRFWQNEGESLKISKRVSYYQKENVKMGNFRGGSFIPFGYKLVDQGSRNYKGRNILDLVIEEKEAKIVQLMYSLSIYKNYGASRIASYLNENGYLNRKGKYWSASSIQVILTNPIYKGYLHMYSQLYDELVLSKQKPDLVIIPEEMWEVNRLAMEQRKYKKKSIIEKDARNTHGKLLLSGLAYCGHCGERLTTMTAYKKWITSDGVKHSYPYYKYRCSSFYKKGGVKCDGQTTYGRSKIEPVVIDEVKDFILKLQSENLNQEMAKRIKIKKEGLEKSKDELIKEKNRHQEELNVLKNEIAKSLMGQSHFTPELLNEMIIKKNKEINRLASDISALEEKIKEFSTRTEKQLFFNQDLKNWSEKFDNADEESKKAMLASVLEKVLVYRDNIELIFNIKIDTYKNGYDID